MEDLGSLNRWRVLTLAAGSFIPPAPLHPSGPEQAAPRTRRDAARVVSDVVRKKRVWVEHNLGTRTRSETAHCANCCFDAPEHYRAPTSSICSFGGGGRCSRNETGLMEVELKDTTVCERGTSWVVCRRSCHMGTCIGCKSNKLYQRGAFKKNHHVRAKTQTGSGQGYTPQTIYLFISPCDHQGASHPNYLCVFYQLSISPQKSLRTATIITNL